MSQFNELKRILEGYSNSINSYNGIKAASLLSLNGCDESEKRRVTHTISINSGHSFEAQINSYKILTPWANIFTTYLNSLYHSHIGKHNEAFSITVELIDQILKFLADDSSKESIWWLPILRACVIRFRHSAYAADQYNPTEKTKKNEVATTLQKCFGEMNRDRSSLEKSKKMGNIRLCSSIIRNVQSPTFPSLESFNLSDTTCYMYYVGRLSLSEEKFGESMETLSYAFKQCDPISLKNKRRIMEFLIPARLLMGYFPKESVLLNYKLTPFLELTTSIRKGDLLGWNKTMKKYSEYFIMRGIYLILDQTKQYVYRNLFRKVFVAYGYIADSKKTQLPINYLVASLNINGVRIDIAEVECIAANLIAGGWMKGYIAHGRCLVLSNKEPFPNVSEVMKSKSR